MVHASRWLLTNRMNELFTSGSVGGAAGNRCLYPAPDLAIGGDFNCSTRILVHFATKMLTPHPPGK